MHDVLVETLQENKAESVLNLSGNKPHVIMMVGLQGSGKTTSTAKIARLLQSKHNHKVLMVSLDVVRPAAQEQLKVLGDDNGVATLPIIPNQNPVDITKRALQSAQLSGYDLVLLDTAGRLSIDEQLMVELNAVKEIASPVAVSYTHLTLPTICSV